MLKRVFIAFSRQEHGDRALSINGHVMFGPLVDYQRYNFVALNREVVIKRDRTSVECSRYLDAATTTSVLSSLKVAGSNWNLYFSIVFIIQSSIIFPCVHLSLSSQHNRIV